MGAMRDRAESLLEAFPGHRLRDADFEAMGYGSEPLPETDPCLDPVDGLLVDRDGQLRLLPADHAQGTNLARPSPTKPYNTGHGLVLLSPAMPGKVATMSPSSVESPQPTGSAFEPLVATQQHDGPVTQAPRGLPGGAAHSARRSGSNSSEESALVYGECRHCDRVFLMQRGATVPYHHNPLVAERGPHPICPGSKEAPGSYLEA